MFVDRQEDYSKVLDTQRLTRIQKAIIDEQKKIQKPVYIPRYLRKVFSSKDDAEIEKALLRAKREGIRREDIELAYKHSLSEL